MENSYNLTIEDDFTPCRIDIYLAEKFPDLTRTFLKKLLNNKLVEVNGNVVKASFKLKPGQEISFTIPFEKEIVINGQDIALDIVFEDEHLIVVNKPRGLTVHPGAGNPDSTLINAIVYHCEKNNTTLSSIGAPLRPGIVHRIDKDTAGLLVIAKTDKAYNVLSEGFREKTIGRIYKAICWGRFSDDEGIIAKSIGRDRLNRKKISTNSSALKKAVTHYKVLTSYNYFTYVELKLETGRTHQIRVHLESIKHPIVGDETYCNRCVPEKLDAKLKIYLNSLKTQMLFAQTLEFDHPVTGEHLSFNAPLPEDMAKLLDMLNELGG